jgi:hypothetical protein
MKAELLAVRLQAGGRLAVRWFVGQRDRAPDCAAIRQFKGWRPSGRATDVPICASERSAATVVLCVVLYHDDERVSADVARGCATLTYRTRGAPYVGAPPTQLVA